MGDQILFQDFLVAFVDLVGQRDSLRKMSALPATPAEGETFTRTARDSLGKVLELRERLNAFLTWRRNHKLWLTLAKSLPKKTVRPSWQNGRNLLFTACRTPLS